MEYLQGKWVYLTPAIEADREIVRPLAKNDRIWEFTKTLVIDEGYDAMFDRYFDEALGLETAGLGRLLSSGRGNRCQGLRIWTVMGLRPGRRSRPSA